MRGLFLLVMLLLSPVVMAKELHSVTGVPVVLDGDTVKVFPRDGGEFVKIRMIGMDAPEKSQLCNNSAGNTYPCGMVAKNRLSTLIDSREVTCQWTNRDLYGRALGTCSVAGVDDLNRQLVQEGYAWAYLSKVYVDAEADAKARKVNIWQAENERASDYRRRQRGK